MRLHFENIVPSSARGIAGVLLALAFSSFASPSVAQDEVRLSAAQARNIGVRVTHPVSSRTDQTLPYPAQIVIPTPQMWVVSAPVAGMLINLQVGRGDHIVAELIRLTNHFEPPSWACATHIALFSGLCEFEADLKQHVHLENDVLFPRAIQLEAELKVRS